jgi:hypothetical protein
MPIYHPFYDDEQREHWPKWMQADYSAWLDELHPGTSPVILASEDIRNLTWKRRRAGATTLAALENLSLAMSVQRIEMVELGANGMYATTDRARLAAFEEAVRGIMQRGIERVELKG